MQTFLAFHSSQFLSHLFDRAGILAEEFLDPKCIPPDESDAFFRCINSQE